MGKPNQSLDLPPNSTVAQRVRRRMRWQLLVYATLVATLLIAWLPTVTTPTLPRRSTASTDGLAALINAPGAAAQSTSPGGISTDLAWWFQGNAGVQTNGTAVTGWNDMVGTLDTTQGTAANQPSYTRYQNFNPVVTFDGSTDFLRNTPGYWQNRTSNQQYNVFAVSTAQNTGNHSLFGENTSAGVQTFWAPGGGTAYNGLYNTYISTAAWGGVVGTPNLWTGRFNNNSSPKVNAIQRDGRQIANNTTTIAFNGANASFYIGIHDGANYRFQGDIAELVMYDRDLTAAERNQVESYLAIKWGITLMGTQAITYTDSAGTIVWNATANSAYQNDVAGIGRDDNAGLNQKQSRSINSDDLVTIGLGAIAMTNISNTNTFTNDRSFLLWGNNNGDIRYLDPYTRTAGLNTRLDRVWKVANTAASGPLVSNVEFCVPATTQATHLLVNTSDPTFVSATTAISLTSKSAAGVASLCAGGLSFADGAYFTLARFVQAPVGIVSNVAWWFRGDVGVQTSGTAVTGWNDSAIGWANGTDLPAVTQATVNNQPSYTRYQNFNPVVTFDGSTDFLRNTAGFWKSSTNNQQYNVFAVSTVQNTGVNSLFGEDTSAGTQFFWAPNGGTVYHGFNPSYLSNATWGSAVGTPNLWTGRFNNSSSPKVNAIGRDGRQIANGTSTATFNGANAPLYIGIHDGANYRFQGDIAEVVMYDRDLTTAERQRIESYLALKWGVSLAQNTPTNYVASDDTVIWSATTNVSYTHDIAGIGVDALAELNQKQSRSVNSDDLVMMGLGVITTTNISNTSTFAADRSFLFWGNNNGDIRFLRPYTGTAALNTRLDRVWKVDNTKAVSNVEFCVPATTQATHLLVNASDPTFSSGTVETALTAKTAAGQASLCASGLTFADGVYFTLARFVQAPVGIVANVAWWFRGDVGVQTSGTAVTGWNDSAIGWANGTDLPSVTQATVNNQPSYTRYQNFNPVVTFDGSTDFLRNTAGFWKNSTNNQQYNFFAVSNAQNTGNHSLFGEDTSVAVQTFWAPSGGNVYNGLYNTYISNAAWGGVVGTPNLWTGRFNNSSTPKVNAIGRDGRQLVSGTTTIAFNGTNAALYVGIHDGANYRFQGDIAELVMYDRDLTATERQRIESYLALKWGVSLAQNTPTNYVASDDTVIWNATTNVSYTHDIAGIGVDALAALNQKQSRSVNSDDLVMMGLGVITTTNISNTSTFAADRSFLIWGNNNGDIRYLKPYTNTTGINARLARVWKVDNTKAVSNVEFCVPATTQASHLLVNNSDPTFVSATTAISLTTKTAAGQASLCTSNLTFADGAYFTLARFVQAPVGIVSNVAWWFRGDVGVQTAGTAVTGWDDSAIGWANGTDLPAVTQATAGNQPSYTRYQNFNPVVTFDGSNDYLRNTAGFWKNSTSNQQYNVFAVSNVQSTGNNTVFAESTSSGAQFIWAPAGGTVYHGLWNGSLSNAAWGGVVGTPNLWTGRFNNSSTPKVNAIGRDGRQVATNTTTTAFDGANAPLYLGQWFDATSYPFYGDIAEVVMYDRDLTTAERQRIESYLALKWGVSLAQNTATNYVASDDTVIWSATTNVSYTHDIAGIGVDALSELNQKQSRSVNNDDLVMIGLGAIAGANISNTNTFAADRSFLIWGNNNGDIRYLRPYTNTTGINARLARVWKVDNTKAVSNVEFCVPATTQASHLLVNASDPIFSSGTVATALTAKTAAGQASLCASGLTFADGAYFTLARFVQTPVGIVANVAWWFRGDVGVQTTGTAVTGWNDSAIGWANGTDLPAVTQGAAANRPTYTRYQNFNPVVTFDGANDYLRNTAGFWKSSTNNQQYNVFAVSNVQSAGNNTVFAESTSSGAQFIWAPAGGTVYHGLWNSYYSNAAWGGVVGTPNLWTGRFNNSSTPKVNAIGRDGRQIATNTTTTAFDGANAPLYLGNWVDATSYPFYGDIAEVVMYDRDLTTAERQRIESYLALKWGVSLSQNTPTNYVASDDTVIWSATTNVSYTHNIAGIGVDALAELNQKQSRSVNSDDLVTIGLGAIAGANISNTNTFAADRSFLLWGNNNGDIRYQHPYSGSGVVNTRLDRVWKVDNTKAVSNVEFCVPATTQATRLLVNPSDPTFVSATTEISLTTKTVAGQVSLCASNQTFNDGVYFTLARYNQAPGSVVTNLAWWFRGDVGVQTSGTAVTGWDDSAIGWANGTDLPSVTQAAAANRPTYTRYQNFNPVVTFDGSNDYLRNTAGFWKSSTNNQQYNVFAVSNVQSTGNNTVFAESTSSGAQFIWAPAGGNVYHGLWNGSLSNAAWGGVVGTPNLWTGRFNNSSTPKVNAIGRDGRQVATNTTTTAFDGANAPLYLGQWFDATSYPFYGDIAEVVLYDRDLTAAERNKVESYLALKYGITLMGAQAISYTNSAGTVVWNAVTNSAYHNDVAGIGRDDSAGLNQKQSASVNSDNLVTIGLGALATANISNTRTFVNDRAFLIWGNNNGVLTFDTPIAGTELKTMTRLWKVTETGTGGNPVGSVKVRIPSSAFVGANPHIVRSTDITFTTSDTILPLVDDGNGNMEAVIDFANGNYFTLAQEPPPAPGAVNNNLAWWFRGDWGVQTSSTAVTQWNDGTGVLNVSQAALANRPTYTKYQNFNRIVTFDGSNDYLRNAGGYWKASTNNQQYNTFIVSINRNAGGVNAAFGENTGLQPQIMFLPYSGNAYNGFWSSYLANSNQIGTVGTPYLWSGRFNNSSSPKLNTIRRDGIQLASSASTAAFSGNNSPLDIGASVPNGWYYNGDIAEVVMYDRDLTTIERQRVESYLAIKWGVTLGSAQAISYTNSTGTVIWNATNDSAYSYRVAGIGFDKYTALDQRISRSNSPGGVVTIATTDDFSSPNLDNSRTALSANSYMLWGDNNQDATTWVTNTVASGYPTGKARLTREWLVRSTGSLPPVSIGVQVNDTTLDLPEVYGVLYLIVDRDGDGSFSDEAAQRMTARGNGLYTIANITLGNGMHFTFGTAAGGIRGEVFQDNDTDGLHDPNEPGLDGVAVTAIDAAGTTTTTVTDIEGKYIFLNSGLEGNTRVTFDLPSDIITTSLLSTAAVSALDNLTSTILGSNSRTSVQFVYVGDGWTVATAGFTSKDRPSPCANPTVATVCYENGAGSNLPGWLSFGFNSGPNLYRTEASSKQMGAVWGNAYNILTGQLYTAALLKRHVGLGPLAAYNGTDTYTVDGVYVVQYNNSVGSFNASTPGFTLQGVSGVDLGTVRRQPDTNGRLDNDYEIMAKGVSKDVDTFNKAGTVGFGNADIFAGSLWLVNANQRALIKVNVTGLAMNGDRAPAANVAQYAITNPGCSNGDFRPWALTFYNGLGYVGVVCSAETSQARSDLHAYILSFAPGDVGAGFTNVLDFPLNYTREPASWGGLAGWQPWVRTPADVKNWLSYPQPILSDIDFTATGDMILGFMDRWGLQNTVNDPNPVTGAQHTAETTGDLMRACATGSNTWAIEGDTGCTGYSEAAGLNKLTNDGPFSAGEFFDDDTHMQCHGGNLHYENITGSGCVVGNTVLATKYGSFSEGGTLFTAGLVKFNATTGANEGVYVMPNSLPCTMNDANSLNNALGEVACICPALPVEIGNRAWNDYNHNGSQDPGEPSIAGLMVELVNASSSVIATAITDARGEYYFSSAPGTSTSSAKYGLAIPGTGVVVRIPNASGGSQQAPLAGLTLTVANQGADDRLDSDATTNGANAVIPVNTTGGRIDHTYDFGFAPDIWDIALRKTVSLQYAAPGDNVTFAIEVFNQIGGPMDNIVLIDYVPANLSVNDPNWTPSTLTGPGTITRTLNAGDELPVGGLLPGKSVVVNLTTQILSGVANNTVVTNTVEVASVTDINNQPFTDRDSTPDTNKTNDPLVDDMIDNTGGDEDDHDVAVVIVTAQTDIYDLALRKTTEATIVSEGDDVPFTIELFNQGTMAANNIQLVDRYPAGFTLSPNETGWSDQGNGTATRVLASRLEPGASTKVTILLRAGSTMGNLQNYAEIQQDDDDDVDSQPEEDELDGNGDALIDNIISDNGTNDEDDHDIAPVTVRRFDLALRKRLATGEANPTAKGADVTFVIDVFNQGSVNAYDITVVDYLSPTLTVSENDANGWIAGNANQVLNSIPGPLAPGTSARLTITLRVSDTTPFGIINNYAEIARASETPAGEATADADSTPDDGNGNDVLVDDVIDNSNNDEDDHDIASVTIGRFDLALTKVYRGDEGSRGSGGNKTDAIIGVGERVTFTLSITNQGTVTAYDIRVTDNSPKGMIIDDSNLEYNIFKGWQVENDQRGHYVFPGPLAPGASASIDVIIFAVGPKSPFYPAGGIDGVKTVWGEISAASYKPGGPTVIDEDSTPDADETNDPGGQPNSPADNDVNGNGTGTVGDGVSATDEDDHDPAQVTVIPSFDLAIIKYPLVDALGGDAIPLVQPGELITYEYRIVNQSLQTAENITLTEHIPAGLILDDPNWTPSTLVGPGLAERVHNGLNLTENGVYTDIVRFRVNPAIAVSTIYTNVIEISAVTGPSNTPVVDMDSTPNRDGATQKVVKDNLLTDNYLADPELFDEDDNDIAVLGAEIEDWSDNPDTGVGTGALNYSTVITDNGARHLVIDGLHLGDLVDGETDGFPTDGAFGDDSDNTDDEDGVNLDDLNLIIGDNATIRVRATNIISSPAYLYGFVDFNANGVLTDTGEVISVTVPMNSVDAEFTLNFGTVPNNGVTSSYVRFRLSTADDLTAVGAAPDGEIEDYPVFMTANVVDLALRKVRTSAATIQPDSDVTFAITVINQGAVTATNIAVVDYLPAGFTLSTNDNNGWNSGPNGTVTKSLAATLTPSGTVNATTNVNIVLTASGATNGTYTNTAEIAAVTDENGIPAADIDSIADATNGNGSGESTALEDDQVTENGKLAGQDEDDHDLATVNVNVLAANLQLTKQATPNVSKSGDTVIYTLTLFNEGPGDATNAVVQDELPTGVTYVSHDPTAAATYNTTTRTINWTVASLPANSSTTLTITVVVD